MYRRPAGNCRPVSGGAACVSFSSGLAATAASRGPPAAGSGSPTFQSLHRRRRSAPDSAGRSLVTASALRCGSITRPGAPITLRRIGIAATIFSLGSTLRGAGRNSASACPPIPPTVFHDLTSASPSTINRSSASKSEKPPEINFAEAGEWLAMEPPTWVVQGCELRPRIPSHRCPPKTPASAPGSSCMR